ncbi:MAG: hypothetical protein JSV79_12105 [Armatimonadota bacterium]|nr:MAG: hypothetical protein JSV79_12105 [Armatimonadota bacterium]
MVLGAPRETEDGEQRAAITGCGLVGRNVAKVGAGMGVHVSILDTEQDRLKCLGEAELLEGRK